jgi:hypothetical protein
MLNVVHNIAIDQLSKNCVFRLILPYVLGYTVARKGKKYLLNNFVIKKVFFITNILALQSHRMVRSMIYCII